MDAARGFQSVHALFLVVDATVTAIVPLTMTAALMFHLLLTSNTVVSKITIVSLAIASVNTCPPMSSYYFLCIIYYLSSRIARASHSSTM